MLQEVKCNIFLPFHVQYYHGQPRLDSNRFKGKRAIKRTGSEKPGSVCIDWTCAVMDATPNSMKQHLALRFA